MAKVNNNKNIELDITRLVKEGKIRPLIGRGVFVLALDKNFNQYVTKRVITAITTTDYADGRVVDAVRVRGFSYRFLESEIFFSYRDAREVLEELKARRIAAAVKREGGE